MAEGIHSRLSAREGRRFAFTLTAAFLGLALILRWRGMPTGSAAAASLAVLLLLAGLFLPARLGPVFRAWMVLALAISRVTTPLLMGLVFFLAVVPTGLLARLVGHRPLDHAEHDDSLWIERPADARRSDLRRQF